MVHLRGKPGFTVCGRDVEFVLHRGVKRRRRTVLQTTEYVGKEDCESCSRYDDARQIRLHREETR